MRMLLLTISTNRYYSPHYQYIDDNRMFTTITHINKTNHIYIYIYIYTKSPYLIENVNLINIFTMYTIFSVLFKLIIKLSN